MANLESEGCTLWVCIYACVCILLILIFVCMFCKCLWGGCVNLNFCVIFEALDIMIVLVIVVFAVGTFKPCHYLLMIQYRLMLLCCNYLMLLVNLLENTNICIRFIDLEISSIIYATKTYSSIGRHRGYDDIRRTRINIWQSANIWILSVIELLILLLGERHGI